jgi:aminoglycoside phosphotransferase (APT) family kinase protein
MSDTDNFSGTRPVAAEHAFDVARLAEFMRAHVDGYSGELTVEQFKGGQSNPTFRLTAGGKNYVLRRKPPGVLLPSAHAVDREFRVISALAKTNVPVARAYALCEDVSVIGTTFYIMDCVEGRILWDPSLPGMSNADRVAHYNEMNRVISELHRVDPEAVGLSEYGKPGNYIERQVSRWTKQYRAAETEAIDAADQLIDWLPKYIPAGDETRIVHGDFRIDNVIFHPTDARIVAVLDWELSTLGHPLADLTYHLSQRLSPNGHFEGMTDARLVALGIPTREEYVGRYCDLTGRRDGIEQLDFYLAFHLFRTAGIMFGIAGRAKAGTAAGGEASELGKLALPLAERALELAKRLGA